VVTTSEWLETQKAAFIKSKQNDTTSKVFFPAVVKEFREKWPVPPATDAEITEAGSAEQVVKAKRTKYDKVCASC
jgi:hypothetical protein